MSVRDIERAMIMFEYFRDKMDVLGKKMDSKTARDLEMEEEEEVSLFISVPLSSVCDAPSLLCLSPSGTCTTTFS